jgi:diphthine synthase
MLTFVGLGLYDEHSITVEGRQAVAEADRVFAESYSSHLAGATVADLERYHDVEVESRDRAGIERNPEPVLAAAASGQAVLLVGGDPMVSTTHVDLRLRAHERSVDTRVVHGTSAATAAASLTGLQNYRFGPATTLPFPDAHGGDEVPGSVRRVLGENRTRGLHTLVYLDIKAAEDRYMTADHAADLLLSAWGDDGSEAPDRSPGEEGPLAVAVCRAGSDDPVVDAGSLAALADRSFGEPLHLLVVPGELHEMERAALDAFGEASFET